MRQKCVKSTKNSKRAGKKLSVESPPAPPIFKDGLTKKSKSTVEPTKSSKSKSPLKKYAKGRRFEYDVRHLFEKLGMNTLRSAGSHSPWDIVAWNRSFSFYIQCKHTAVTSDYDLFLEEARCLPPNSCPVFIEKNPSLHDVWFWLYTESFYLSIYSINKIIERGWPMLKLEVVVEKNSPSCDRQIEIIGDLFASNPKLAEHVQTKILDNEDYHAPLQELPTSILYNEKGEELRRFTGCYASASFFFKILGALEKA